MIANAKFDVTGFTPISGAPEVGAGLPVGVATIDKTFSGDVAGTSVAFFTSAFDQAAGAGTYVALETFAGSLHGVEGGFSFVHVASTGGDDRFNVTFFIVPLSGSGGLAGISGTGDLAIDGDEHSMRFDYEIG